MKSIAKACSLALCISLAAAPLAACGGGGGGGGGGPVSPPPASPPPSPPPSPPANTSGGTISSSGAFQGTFRGPASAFGTINGVDTLGSGGATTPGSANDVVVTVGATSGVNDDPTVTIQFLGSTRAFDFDQAQSIAYGGGFITEDAVAVSTSATDWLGTKLNFNFGGQRPFYSGMYSFAELGTDLKTGIIVVGADRVTMPTTGSATFDTGVYGLFVNMSGSDGGFFFSRGDLSANFGSGTVAGTFADVDFHDPADSATMETTLTGIDFGLSINANVTGDNFAGSVVSTNPGVSMTGDVSGDFFGPLNGAPAEIGGAFDMIGSGGIAYGALQGIKR